MQTQVGAGSPRTPLAELRTLSFIWKVMEAQGKFLSRSMHGALSPMACEGAEEHMMPRCAL